MSMREVQEEEYGVYIWIDGQGRRIADSDGNTLNIPSKRGDRTKVEALRQAARHWGILDGKAKFIQGARQVTQGEYDYQVERLKAGLIPDPLDFRAMEEQQRYANTRND